MKFLRNLFKKQSFETPIPDLYASKKVEPGFSIDYLGQAAHAGSMASEAMESGDFDTAWDHYQKASQFYLQHAQKEGVTVAQTLALVGRVHRGMARLLRQEGKHHDALVHILYCTACSNAPLERELKQYRPFVNRCKFSDIDIAEVTEHLADWRAAPDLRVIRDVVDGWKAREISLENAPKNKR